VPRKRTRAAYGPGIYFKSARARDLMHAHRARRRAFALDYTMYLCNYTRSYNGMA